MGGGGSMGGADVRDPSFTQLPEDMGRRDPHCNPAHPSHPTHPNLLHNPVALPPAPGPHMAAPGMDPNMDPGMTYIPPLQGMRRSSGHIDSTTGPYDSHIHSTTLDHTLDHGLDHGLSALHLLPDDGLEEAARMLNSDSASSRSVSSASQSLAEQSPELAIQDDYINTTQQKRGKPLIKPDKSQKVTTRLSKINIIIDYHIIV